MRCLASWPTPTGAAVRAATSPTPHAARWARSIPATVETAPNADEYAIRIRTTDEPIVFEDGLQGEQSLKSRIRVGRLRDSPAGWTDRLSDRRGRRRLSRRNHRDRTGHRPDAVDAETDLAAAFARLSDTAIRTHPGCRESWTAVSSASSLGPRGLPFDRVSATLVSALDGTAAVAAGTISPATERRRCLGVGDRTTGTSITLKGRTSGARGYRNFGLSRKSAKVET